MDAKLFGTAWVFMVVLLLALAGGMAANAGAAEARTIKHRSWKGYTVCYSHKVKLRRFKKTHRCYRHRSLEFKVRRRAIRFARHQVGKPYIYGSVGMGGFDCSGLVYRAYSRAGRRIPRTTYAQLAGLRRERRHRRPGDLVFAHAGHVAMYVGHGRVIEAPRTGLRIRVTSSIRFHAYTRSPF